MTAPARAARRPRRPTADLRVENEWLSQGVRTLAGMDEVGRGALAGPVSVGVVVVDAVVGRPPRGLTDSKLLSARSREEMVPHVQRWARAYAVGHASNAEIDSLGIIGGLRLAGRRALASVAAEGVTVDAVLLDGSHDWLSDPPADLFDLAELPVPVPALGVRTLVKADLRCASVAAASVLAKCERDDLMRELAGGQPGYDWGQNKGYASAAHVRALGELGVSSWHRASWNLPGVAAGAKSGGDGP